MSKKSPFYAVLKYPLRWLTRFEDIWDGDETDHKTTVQKPVAYVMRSTSTADLSILQRAAKRRGLPDPLGSAAYWPRLARADRGSRHAHGAVAR